MINSNSKTNKNNEYAEKNSTDQMIDQLIKENEILSKLVKGKSQPNEALNSLYNILSSQRNKIDSLSNEHLSLEQSIEQLQISIESLRNRTYNTSENTTSFKPAPAINKTNQSVSIKYNPSELLSFSGLMGKTSQHQSLNLGNLMQLSVTNFSKRNLAPISKSNTNISQNTNEDGEQKIVKKKKKKKKVKENNEQ